MASPGWPLAPRRASVRRFERPLLHLAVDDPLLEDAHAVDHEDAVEVIVLVLDGYGEEAVGLELERLAVAVERPDGDGPRPLDVLADAGEGEAARRRG